MYVRTVFGLPYYIRAGSIPSHPVGQKCTGAFLDTTLSCDIVLISCGHSRAFESDLPGMYAMLFLNPTGIP